MMLLPKTSFFQKMDGTLVVQAGERRRERQGSKQGRRQAKSVHFTSCWAERGAGGVLSCAELIIEDERAWQFIPSHTKAPLTTPSEDRRIHLFNFCCKKQTSNDTTEKKAEMPKCNKMSISFLSFFSLIHELQHLYFVDGLRRGRGWLFVVVVNSREGNVCL